VHRDLVVGLRGHRLVGQLGRPPRVATGQGRLGRDQPGGRRVPGHLGPLGLEPGRLRRFFRQNLPTEQIKRGQGCGGGRGDRTGVEAVPRLRGELGQRGQIEPVGVQHIAGRLPRDPVRAEQRAEPAHEHRELVGRMAGSVVAPDNVSQRVGGHRRAPGDGEATQHPARLAAAQPGQVDALHSQPAEHPYPHRHLTGIPPHSRY
jgi:hypothetical protein